MSNKVYEGSKLDKKLDKLTGFKDGSKKDHKMDGLIAKALHEKSGDKLKKAKKNGK